MELWLLVPPSTVRTWPVTYRDSSEARKSIAWDVLGVADEGQDVVAADLLDHVDVEVVAQGGRHERAGRDGVAADVSGAVLGGDVPSCE